MTPTAKSVVLELLTAAGGAALPVRTALAACDLFDLSPNNARVALARLSSAGLIEPAGRGEYRLAQSAEKLAREVMSWQSAEERVKGWTGGYVAVFTGALGRTDRVALRRRARALSILGFAESERGLYLRPDNLIGGVDSVRNRLGALGLDPHAPVFAAASFTAEYETHVLKLWDGQELTDSYRRSRLELERWLKRSAALELDVAAREAFLLGRRAIRRIVYDPLLPPPFVDVAERRAFIATMKEMDRVGRGFWKRFFAARGHTFKRNDRTLERSRTWIDPRT